MKVVIAVWFSFALIVATALALRDVRLSRRNATLAKQQLSIALAKYAEEASKVQPTADTVVKWTTRVAYKRDTLLKSLTDTVLIKEFVYATDTLRVACENCAKQLVRLKWTADSTINALHYVIRRQTDFRQRFGFFAGYGISGGQESSVRHGVVIGVGVRVFP